MGSSYSYVEPRTLRRASSHSLITPINTGSKFSFTHTQNQKPNLPYITPHTNQTMQPSASFLPFLFFLLFIAFTISAEVVFDSDGEMLRNGGKYYLSPATTVGGGAIIYAPIRHGDTNLCSLAVVSVPYTKGWAVTISSRFRAPFIQTSLPLNLKFEYFAPRICTDSPDWVVVKSLPLGEAVVLGDEKEFGDAYVSGWFSIKTYDTEKHHYKLVFCEKGKDECGNIGVKLDSEKRRRLVVTDKEPLVFKFDKVSGNFNSDLSMVV